MAINKFFIILYFKLIYALKPQKVFYRIFL
jgi:hypothetical protein